MKIVYMAIAALLIGFPAHAAQSDCPAPQAVAVVDGMVCDFCAQGLKKVFLQESAVRDVAIDLTTKEVRLTLKPGASIDDAVIRKKVDWAGYTTASIIHSCAGHE